MEKKLRYRKAQPTIHSHIVSLEQKWELSLRSLYLSLLKKNPLKVEIKKGMRGEKLLRYGTLSFPQEPESL